MKMTAFLDIAPSFLVQVGQQLYMFTASIIRAMHGVMFQKAILCNRRSTYVGLHGAVSQKDIIFKSSQVDIVSLDNL
jgi:hypothetical protein